MNRKTKRINAIALDLIESKYFAMDVDADTRIRLATQAAVRQVSREREERDRLISDVAYIVLLMTVIGVLFSVSVFAMSI